MRTQVGIVGAGPAGLTLGRLLERAGIEAVVIENRIRDYVEHRIRAGVLEQGTADLLVEAGVGDRMQREGIVHHGIELQFDGERHRDPAQRARRRPLDRDLRPDRGREGPDRRAARQPARRCLFEVEDVSVDDLDTDRPRIRFTHEGAQQELECDVIAGCDGFHGVCRPAIPAGVLRTFERDYPYGWLGILAAVAPSNDELVYANHERGFALLSLRSPELSRLYIQCRPDEDIAEWPDDRIWEELHARLGARRLDARRRGRSSRKGVTGMRSFVAEPMQHGRLYLAGDAAHIVPPTGAKGLNLAIADVKILAEALVDRSTRGNRAGLDAYSTECLRRVWRAEHFS